MSKMMDKLFQFNLLKPNFSSLHCSMKTEPGTECKIFAGKQSNEIKSNSHQECEKTCMNIE